jgi:hypothetical protein
VILDANEQAGYLGPGVLGSFSSASFTLVTYDFISFEMETLTQCASFDSESIVQASFAAETLEPI